MTENIAEDIHNKTSQAGISPMVNPLGMVVAMVEMNMAIMCLWSPWLRQFLPKT